MHCPYCQSPVSEDAPSCPRCGLSLEKAGAYFGTAPRLVHGVSDSAGVLSAGARRRIRRRIAAFERRFPQSGFTVAFMALGKEIPGATYTYWIFNRCNPAGELIQGAENRHVFLLVDTAGHGAWLTVGYGLEPFIGADHLHRFLDRAEPHFAKGRYAAGVIALLAEVEVVFREVVASLPRVFGVEGIETRPAAPAPEPASAW
jgi:uncharacterized membrane protein YgcG